jgi:hypothetical protein
MISKPTKGTQIRYHGCPDSKKAADKLTQEEEEKYVNLMNSWIKRYRYAKRPVPVNFSKLTPHYYIKDRATHLIHFYPAKLLSQIPEFFIRALSKQRDSVLDPFAGSGTVLLEAVLAGRRPLAAELNPLARLITQVKTTPIPVEILEYEAERLLKAIDLRKYSIHAVPSNLYFWHTPAVVKQLSAILNALRTWTPTRENRYKDPLIKFFTLAFSSIIRKKSLADPRVAPPVKLKPVKFKPDRTRYERTKAMLIAKKRPDCVDTFRRAIEEAIKRVASLHDQVRETIDPCIFVSSDARNIPLDGSVLVDLILTSPPYIAAQKYIRSTSLELFWMGYLRNGKDRAALEHRMVGSEIPQLQRGQSCPKTEIPAVDRIVKRLWLVNRGRAKMIANYFTDMVTILNRLNSVLTPGGHLVLIVGNNTVCGRPIPVSRILRNICTSQLGFSCRAVLVDKIRAYGLMTKRNHTSGIITREYILVMQKPLMSKKDCNVST